MEEIIEGSRQLRDLGFGDRPGRGGAGGRSMPPQEQKLEALGTIIAEDGLTVLSLSRVDPTATLLSSIRTPGGSVNVNYTEVLLLMQDGTEVPAKLLLKDTDLDLAYVLPIKEKGEKHEKRTFSPSPVHPKPKTLCLWTRSYLWANWGETSTDNQP